MVRYLAISAAVRPSPASPHPSTAKAGTPRRTCHAVHHRSDGNTLADDPGGSVAGQTTLRDAITEADAGLTANKYVIRFAVDGTIALANRLPDLANNIVIKGPGAANLTIQGDNAFTIFTVDNGEIVKISGMTIEGGKAHNGGGGIDNSGTMTVIGSNFTGNFAAFGGGIYNDGAATVIGSTFIGNSSVDSGGGGIYQLWYADSEGEHIHR